MAFQCYSKAVVPMAAIAFYVVITLACVRCGSSEHLKDPATVNACGAPLGNPADARRSSLRSDSCDYGEGLDYTYYDFLCAPDTSCDPPMQTGDEKCHRICDDGECAGGERCDKRPVYVSDTPTRYLNLCVCDQIPCLDAPEPAAEGGLALWQHETPLPVDLYYHAAAADSQHLFVAGGLHLTEIMASSASAEVVRDVWVSAVADELRWVVAGKLPTALNRHAMAVFKNRLYVTGGGASNEGSTDVWSAGIRDDGTLDEWRSEAALPAPRSGHRLLADDSRLIVAGGLLDSRYSDGTNRIWTAAPSDARTIDSWSETLAPVNVFSVGGAGLAHGRLYVLGEDGKLHSASLDALEKWRDEVTWNLYRPVLASSKPTDVNMGPVLIFEQCDTLVAVLKEGNVVTAPLDAHGVVGSWRVASRFYGAATGFAIASTGSQLFALGGSTGRTPIERVFAVWSTQGW